MESKFSLRIIPQLKQKQKFKYNLRDCKANSNLLIKDKIMYLKRFQNINTHVYGTKIFDFFPFNVSRKKHPLFKGHRHRLPRHC